MIVNTFIEEVEKIKRDKNIEYIDAVVIWCETNNQEVETAADLILKDPALKLKIQAEAETLNILKKGAKLPL